MGHGDKDPRAGSGHMLAGLRQRQGDVPCDCACMWTVAIPVPAPDAVMELRYPNSGCAHLRRHYAAAAEQQQGDVVRSA